jgi:hypothetical protein
MARFGHTPPTFAQGDGSCSSGPPLSHVLPSGRSAPDLELQRDPSEVVKAMARGVGSTTFGVPLLIACFSATLPVTGCSFLFVQPPHEEYGSRGVIGCTTNRAAPVIDTIFTLTNFFSALYVASEDNVTNKGASVGAGLAVGALWLSSAIYGYYNTSQCSELLADSEDDAPYRRRMPNPRPAWRAPVVPRPAPPPPPPPAPAAAAPVDGGPQAPAEAVPPPVAQPPQAPQAPVAPQQSDDDDPVRPRNQYPVTPRFGN